MQEEDFTEIALSFRSAIKRYFFPRITFLRDDGHSNRGQNQFVCDYLADMGLNSSSVFSDSPFLRSLKQSSINYKAQLQGNRDLQFFSFIPFFCGEQGEMAMDVLVKELTDTHDILSRSTQQVRDLSVDSGTTEVSEGNDGVYERLLQLSAHRPAVLALGQAVKALARRSYVDTEELNEKNKVSEEAKLYARKMNLKLSGGETSVFLFILPHELSLAQELVDRWRKTCGGTVCFIYINYHIVVLGSDSDTDGSADYQKYDYDEERDLQEDIYLRMYRGEYFDTLDGTDDAVDVSSGVDLNSIGVEDGYADEYEDYDENKHSNVAESDLKQTGREGGCAQKLDPRPSKYAKKMGIGLGSFEGELYRNRGTPSLRQALRQLSDILEASILRTDVLLVCVGLEACLGMQVPGGKDNIHIPPGVYQEERLFAFPAPLTLGLNNKSGGVDVNSFGGAAYAVRKLLKNSANMPFLNEIEFREDLIRYCLLHPFDPIHISKKKEEDLFWVAVDTQQHLFRSERGASLYKQMTAESAIFNAKSLLTKSLHTNSLNPNNALSDIVDVIDNSNSVNIFQDNVVFNVTYCSEAHYLVAAGPLHSHGINKDGMRNTYDDSMHMWTGGDKGHLPPSHIATPDSRYEPSFATRSRRAKISSTLGRKLWHRAVSDRISCGVMRARLLVLAYWDDHAGTNHHLGWDLGRGGSGDDPTLINAYTVDGRIQGYDSITRELHVASNTPMPLTPFDNGVYRMISHRTPDGKPDLANVEGLVHIVNELQSLISSGSVWAATSLTLQLQRSILMSMDSHNDYEVLDIVLLKLFELIKFSKHNVQYTPLSSYRKASNLLHANMYSLREWVHFGRNPYIGSDSGRNAAQFSVQSRVARNRFQDPRLSGLQKGSSPDIKAGNKTFNVKGGTARVDGEIPTGSGNGEWGERGCMGASRTSSEVSQYQDAELSPHLSHDLLPGQGRGPVPITDLGLEDEKIVEEEVRNARVVNGVTVFPKRSLRAEAQGREVFGNTFAAGTFSLLAGYSAVTGPFDAMVSAQTKSIAYPDYFTMKSRQQLWDRQSRQLNTVITASGAIGVVTHFLTMANRITDKLQNLMFSANLAGIPLIVVGLKETSDTNGNQEEKDFNYSDKVDAFHHHLQKVRHGTPVEGRGGSPLIADNDIVVMVDAYDVLLFPYARKIGHMFLQEESQGGTAGDDQRNDNSKSKPNSHFKHPIIFCTENGIYPEYSSAFSYQRGSMFDRKFEHGDGGDYALAQKFLNSGCIAGRAGQIRAMVRAAHIQGNAFRNDQQFYSRYQSTFPDLVGLDYHRKAFFTSHKMLTCQSMILLDNALGLSHVTHPNTRTFDYQHHSNWESDLFYNASRNFGDSDYTESNENGPKSQSARHVQNIGVFHANNIKASRTYDQLVNTLSRLMQMHLSGLDQQGLLETIRAITDGDFDRAAFLLSTTQVQSNFTSNGGSNLLGDILITTNQLNLEPALVKLAQSNSVTENSGNVNAFTQEQAEHLAHIICKRSREAWSQSRMQAKQTIIDLEKTVGVRDPGPDDRLNRGEFEFLNEDGSLFVERQVQEFKYLRSAVDQCH